MTAQLKPVSWKTLVRKLSSLGFNGPYAGGKHNFMVINLSMSHQQKSQYCFQYEVR